MENQIFTQEQGFFNARIKYYPTAEGDFKAWDTIIFDKSVYNPDKLELMLNSPSRYDEAEDEFFGGRKCGDEDNVENANKRSFLRAKTKAFDYMMCNPDMNMFVTLTFSPQAARRDEWGEIVRLLNPWLDNRVRRHRLKYLLIPEHHADGATIHFHGLMNEDALALVSSGHFRNGKTVYNIGDYPFGWSTAIRRGASDVDIARVSKYIFKYMTKEEGKIGGRYYLHGGKLEKPRFVYYHAEGLGGLSPVTLECGLAFVREDGTMEDKATFSRVSSDFFKNSHYCKLG